MYDGVDVVRLRSRPNFIGNLLKSVQHQLPGFADTHYIGFFFELNFVSLGIQSPGIFVILRFVFQTAFFIF